MTRITNLDEIKNQEIVTDYEQLSVRCDEFDLEKEHKDARKIILALKGALRAHDDMVAISANQLGFNKRIICMNFNGEIRTFINPIISNVKGIELSRETCHSLPGETYIRVRYTNVEITYQTPTGKVNTVELAGLASRVMQHHIEHLDGILLCDIGLQVFDDFDNAADEERKEVIDMYLDSLDMTAKDFETDVNNDEETKQIADAIRFMESVRKGETIIESIPLTDEEIEELKREEAEVSESND